MKRLASLLLTAIVSLGLAAPVLSAEYPNKPVMLVTVFDPGGGSDVSHRTIEKFAKQYMEQPFVITYKAGAGGEIGWTYLINAKADGYTIGGVDLPHIVLQPMLRPAGQAGYRTEQLNPLCGLVYDPNVVMVREDSPFKNFAELTAYAKANPGKVTVATVGKWTGDHLFLLQIEKATGAKFTQVPYSGGGKASPALVSGEVDCYFGSTSNFKRMEKTKGLAIATKTRFELCPEVPTFIEQGITLESAKYRGLASPLNIPKAAQAYLEQILATMTNNPEYQKAVKGVGIMPLFQTSQEFAATIEREAALAKSILHDAGVLK